MAPGRGYHSHSGGGGGGGRGYHHHSYSSWQETSWSSYGAQYGWDDGWQSSTSSASWQNGSGPYNRNSRNGWGSSNNQGWGLPLEEGTFQSQQPLETWVKPKVEALCSYCYVEKKSLSAKTVLTPAYSARTMRLDFEPPVDLSLARGLKAVQSSNGSFKLTHSLSGLLGLAQPEVFLSFMSATNSRVVATLYVLKTIETFFGADPNARPQELQEVATLAEAFVTQKLQIRVADLRKRLLELDERLPAIEALRSDFLRLLRWSFFELWLRLVPDPKCLIGRGTVWCPRFFVVDLGSAPWSPYDYSKEYPLVIRDGVIMVGQPEGDVGNADAMRHGYCLESKLVQNFWVEEDHLLTKLRLGGSTLIYAAAPDAIEAGSGDGDHIKVPQDQDFRSLGFQFESEFRTARDDVLCQVWRSDEAEKEANSYLEVKKTTHLRGMAGEFKKLKFWLQAVLGGCAATVVCTTEGEDKDVITNISRYSVKDMESKLDSKRVWSILSLMLDHIQNEIFNKQSSTLEEANGPWTLRILKERGPGQPVKLQVWRGFDENEPANQMMRQRVDDMFGELEEIYCDDDM
mmetsp:Transcript_54546/g.119334  ORF Transcript_54546/g.119334 Transcript_54546/m.119334 type:complete len:573 (-) Transcript_54546:255-1973(-)|eukprot:CAMPEP_0206594166 /NCGR_PEP_ID=MMETSP0325_2-20121206/42184_1 /ASSEMBLY_ACC=CAM_ASM_000347 /TAXON_ID=2866 /ORGANISM="Crypthecodinium cohnii, Strain Seligo" /LENGTH=572 /DNA_ID=CAMNT_0054104519 /DNA_START=91 /DNA_END=1809 /DNA_ORIENTATION=+